MHRETKATAIPPSVKAAVAKRDCLNGPATCILCGKPGMPNAHIVRRSRGGMGVEQNIVSLCPDCHRELDEGKDSAMLMEIVVEYIKGFYPDWTPESVMYKKWREL